MSFYVVDANSNNSKNSDEDNVTTKEEVITPQNSSNENCDESNDALKELTKFWPKINEEIDSITTLDWKQQLLPLARIKKIMKLDEEVKMISAEAPLLFAKACEMFICELTLRAWIHTAENKRRTLQRSDIALAISKYDQFDFLIDIVPREEIKVTKPKDETNIKMNSDQVQYYVQLGQSQTSQPTAVTQQSQTLTTSTTVTTPATGIQIVQPQIQTVQLNTVNNSANPTSQNTAPTTVTSGGFQLLQQVVTPTGEIQHIPIQLSAQQLQMIRMQVPTVASANTGNQTVVTTTSVSTTTATATIAQPIIIQAQPNQQTHILQVAQPMPISTSTTTTSTSGG